MLYTGPYFYVLDHYSLLYVKSQSHVLNLLLEKLVQEHTGRILAICYFNTDLALLDPGCQNLQPISSRSTALMLG